MLLPSKLQTCPTYEIWSTTMALGTGSGPNSDRAICPCGASRIQTLAGVCFSAAAAAACGNSKSPASHDKICIAVTRSFAGPCEPGAAALGLHVRGCETQGSRFADRGRYIAQHAVQ